MFRGSLNIWRDIINFGIWELMVVLLIVALLFGTKKLRTIGGDFGNAVKGFRSAMKDSDADNIEQQPPSSTAGQVIEGEVDAKPDKASHES